MSLIVDRERVWDVCWVWSFLCGSHLEVTPLINNTGRYQLIRTTVQYQRLTSTSQTSLIHRSLFTVSTQQWNSPQTTMILSKYSALVDWDTQSRHTLVATPFVFLPYSFRENSPNKKVLLRERKRHTARRVASTPYVVLTPPARVPPWPGYPPSQGTPLARVPPPPARVPPRLDLAGYPPPSYPMAFWVMLQSIMGYGYPPRGQTNKVKLLPSRRTTYAGGNNRLTPLPFAVGSFYISDISRTFQRGR